jgi:hypothetical protein
VIYLTTRADVTNQPVLDQQRADFGVVIGPVEAQALGALRGRGGTVDRDRPDGCAQELVIVAVRAGVIDPERDTSGVGEDRALRPLLARSVGLAWIIGALIRLSFCGSGGEVVAEGASAPPGDLDAAVLVAGVE